MKLLELFAGTRSITKAFELRGHETLSVENDRRHENIVLYEDVLTLTSEKILSVFGRPDVIWASPPCTSYSIAGISHHRQRDESGNLSPKSELAKVSDQLILHTMKLIHELKPVYWFIENPRGGLRKMDFIHGDWRSLVTCEFGTGYAGHTGMDIGIPISTEIRAVADGKVLFTRASSTGYGIHVAINALNKVAAQGGLRERSSHESRNRFLCSSALPLPAILQSVLHFPQKADWR